MQIGFDKAQAIAEARRCLACRACLGCGLCSAICKRNAIDFTQTDEDIELALDTIIITPGAEGIVAPIEEKFGYGKYSNVVTHVGFECILSDTGPYHGLLLRPSDGEMPQKLAFIQCVSNEEQASEFDHYPVVYAIKGAQLARKKIDNLKVYIFCSNIKGYEEQFSRYRSQFPELIFNQGQVRTVREVTRSKNLIIEWGKEVVREEEYEMAVLVTPLVFPHYLWQWSQKLGVNLGNLIHWETTDTTLVKTAHQRIFLAGTQICQVSST